MHWWQVSEKLSVSHDKNFMGNWGYDNPGRIRTNQSVICLFFR